MTNGGLKMTEKISKEEWNAYVNFASSGEWPIPKALIENYDDWLCRSAVGRALFFRKKIEEAMAVLSTTLDVEPSMEVPEKGMSEVEHKVLCLRDLAKIVWGLTGNPDATFRFWDEAEKWCLVWTHKFVSVARGAISYDKATMLMAVGRTDEVEKIINKMVTSDRFERENVNSYRYYAYKFMAENELLAKNKEKAALLYEKAFSYYPLSEAGERDFKEAKAETDLDKKIEKFKLMSKIQYVHWDYVPEAIIRR
jgi:tetratricopeptide (TPR) repeat protein